MKVISFSNVTKIFGKFRALDNLTFSCEENKIFGIIGNNGSGKSTIINIICNIYNCSSGSVMCFDELVTRDSSKYRKRLGVVLTDHPLIDDFKPVQYLNFVGNFQSVQKDKIYERIDKLLTSFSIPDKRIGLLSSGNRIKLSIASSLIHNPDLLIYDEPFNYLDVSSMNNLQERLLSLKLNKSIILTSHNLDVLCNICDEIMIIEEGKKLMQIEVPEDSQTLKKELVKHFTSASSPVNLSWLD